MLIQPKRWVMPTAGALIVFLIMATLWGRSNPEGIQRISENIPEWAYRGSVTAQNPAGKMAGGMDTPIKQESRSSAPDATATAAEVVPVDHAPVGVLDPAHVLDDPSATTSTEIPPIPKAAETTKPAALPGSPLDKGPLDKGLGEKVQGEKGPYNNEVAATTSVTPLKPIPARPPPPYDPKQVVSSDRTPDGTHNIIRSRTRPDGKYFIVDFWGIRSYNPNLIPHPRDNDTWMVTTQRWKAPDENQAWFTQLVCDATWKNNTLVCKESPLILPVQSSLSEHCTGELMYFNLNIGPHDARAFYGPDAPYLVYGTQSQFTCFGQSMQDFRVLTDWGIVGDEPFRFPIDLQRPEPYGRVEKNWFIFWDRNKDMYIHYDVKPHRVFAKVAKDGSVGKDLGIPNREKDDECLARHTANVEESVRKSLHQATNSLMVTMCKRTDPTCKPTDDNTFILSIFQQKSFISFHGVYEPYVMLFRSTPPFETYAFGRKPIWTMGRNMLGEKSFYRVIPEDQSEMVYLTSLNWQEPGLKYHGYLDDVIFVGFGVEDSIPAVIDVTAEDLIGDIMKC